MSERPMGERTEQATPHRLREARRRGQVVKSTELSSALTLMAAVVLFSLTGEAIVQWCQEMVQVMLEDFILYKVIHENMPALMLYAGMSFFRITALIFGVILVTGLAVNYAQVGFVFSAEKISPNFNKLNPVEGFKRIFSKRAVFELIKSLAKILLVGFVVYSFLADRMQEYMNYMFMPPVSGAERMMENIITLSLRVGAIFLILAVMDYVYQRYEHFKGLMMTKQEIKEEFKQMEGDPLIRSKRREKQRQIASQRMMQDVPTASVIITNPTEIAIALKYDAKTHPIPTVVAKGAGIVAAKIREIGKMHQVPILENRPVARLLFQKIEVGAVISVELYQSIAEILAAVYELQRKRQKGR
jgi:flagellar biosynthesis protein FlhB